MVAALLPALFALSAQGQSAVGQTTDSTIVADSAAIDRFIQENLESTGLPGVAVAITRGDRIAYLGGHGHDSSGRAITSDTPMRVGSLSKSFTAFAIMQLVERGRIDLDRPVSAYLPEFAPDDPRAGRITVRQLLNQISGLADAGFPEMSRAQPESLREAVVRLRGAKLVAEPGERWNYHNPNYHVLARLVEVVSGTPFSTYLERNVFGAIGMNHTVTVARAGESIPGLVDGYTYMYGVPVARSIFDHFVAGSGGVISTARDLAKWIILQTNGGRTRDGRQVISAESIQLMHTPSDPSGDYGFGWERDVLEDGSERIEHGGVLFTFSANQALYPATGYGIVILFNSVTPVGAEQMSFAPGLEALLRGDEPTLGRRITAWVDGVLALLTLIALGFGVRNLRGAQVWVQRRAALPVWRTALALGLALVPVVLFLSFPWLLGLLFGNRDVTWTSALFAWPALVVLFAVGALVSAATILVRIVYLVDEAR